MEMAEKISLPRVSRQEFESMPKKEGHRYELIDGVVYDHASPSKKHQTVLGLLGAAIIAFLDDKEYKNCVMVPDCDTICAENVYRPDLAVECDKDPIPKILVEILSPSTKALDLFVKLIKYKQLGVSEYWIVDIKVRTITVHLFKITDEKGDHKVEVYCKDDVMYSPYLGMEIEVRKIFKDVEYFN